MDRLTDNTWELWLVITCVSLLVLWLATEAIVRLLAAREKRRERRELARVSAAWRCTECDWRGRTPSWTDASTEVERNGRLVVDRTHVPLCPRCFERATTCHA